MASSKTSNISTDKHFIVPEKDAVLSRKLVLKDKVIGISISESDNLSELGYGVPHLKDAIIEIARYIVAHGGKIAYGGDMRQGGFTELLFELLAYYKADGKLAPHERFFSYLSYPISATLSMEKEAELRQNVSFVKVEPPPDLAIADQKVFLKPDSTENLYVWARSLTKMRTEMEDACHARVFVGGREFGFKGKCPGILEELLIALDKKRPIYLIGAFGGVTSCIISAIGGKKTSCFETTKYVAIKEYEAFYALYNQKHPDHKIDFDEYYESLKKINWKYISTLNGLTENENKRLAETPHISEMVYLIIKGLSNCLSV